MFSVYAKDTNKLIYVGRSASFALSFVEFLNRRGIRNMLVCS